MTPTVFYDEDTAYTLEQLAHDFADQFGEYSDAEFAEFMWRLEQEQLEAEHHTYSSWADVFVDERGL